jgi:ketosteroid isomerase-like protein
MDAFGASLDPDVIWAALEGWPEAETLVGREACMRQYERMRAAFDVDTVDPITDFIAAGDRVVVRLSWRGTGQGPNMNMELTSVLTLRDYYAFDAGDGLVASVNIFADRAGVEEAERRLAEWIDQTISAFDISPAEVIEGEVFASTRS